MMKVLCNKIHLLKDISLILFRKKSERNMKLQIEKGWEINKLKDGGLKVYHHSSPPSNSCSKISN